MTASHIPWLPRLKHACLEATVVPMAGGLPPFPVATVEQSLREVLRLPELKLVLEDPEFLDEDAAAHKASQQAHSHSLQLHVKASPLQGTATLIIEPGTLWSLMHAALGRPVEGLVPLVDQEINQGFGTFVLLAVLQTLQKASFPPKSRLEWTEQAEGLPAATLGVQLLLGEQSWPCEVLISHALLQSAREASAPRPLADLNPALAQILDLPLDLPVGQVELPWTAIKKLHPGDVIVLDQLDLDLGSGDGVVLLRVGNHDIWSCRLTGGQLIAEQPFPAHAEDRAMSFTPESDDELFDELDELDQLGSFADLEPETAEPPLKSKKRVEKSAEASEETVLKRSAGTMTDRVQVHLTVSLGRLTVTARELFELKAGNVLNFPVQTSGQVDLLVGPDLIGRGELVQLGDAIGVRIVEL